MQVISAYHSRRCVYFGVHGIQDFYGYHHIYNVINCPQRFQTPVSAAILFIFQTQSISHQELVVVHARLVAVVISRFIPLLDFQLRSKCKKESFWSSSCLLVDKFNSLRRKNADCWILVEILFVRKVRRKYVSE